AVPAADSRAAPAGSAADSAPPPPAAVGSPPATAAAVAAGPGGGTARPVSATRRSGTRRCGRLKRRESTTATMTNRASGAAQVSIVPPLVLSDVTRARAGPGMLPPAADGDQCTK